jgi:hypothetical protein
MTLTSHMSLGLYLLFRARKHCRTPADVVDGAKNQDDRQGVPR